MFHEEITEKIDRDKSYNINDAVTILKGFSPTKFDETIDLCINLGVDPKHADQVIKKLYTYNEPRIFKGHECYEIFSKKLK